MKKTSHIVVIDDEKSIQRTLSIALESEGYRTTVYGSGTEALERINGDLPDLIILDIIMPGVDGITFCSRFRKTHSRIPIIYLSSRSDEITKLESLERGGDDYLTKPFSMKELLVRIAVCLRRVEQYGGAEGNPEADATGLVIHNDAYQLRYRGRIINLSVTEFRIFKTLFDSPGRVFTRDELMERAYPEDGFVSDRNVDTHITRIRKKVLAENREFKGIESVYGLGYRYKT
jgi:DNA-binding response OmpR family regulator